jgi:hypothetical protein
MAILEKDVSLSNVYWWNLPVDFDWVDFHQAVDVFRQLAAEAEQPVTIVARPEGDLPTGNAIPHLSRLFNVLKSLASIQSFIIVLNNQHPISKMLMQVISRVYGVPDNFVIVSTVEQALTKIQTSQGIEVNN